MIRHSSRRAATALAVVLMLLLSLLGACSGSGPPDATSTGPHPLTREQADRLAVMRLNLYRAKMITVSATMSSGNTVITINGWVDTVNHEGYALISPRGGEPFLSLWNATEVNAQGYAGNRPPLPHPDGGWESAALNASDSGLAAAQILLVSLSNNRADNPQLLLQNGAQWVRSDTADGVRVDVISGPRSAGTTESNLRYWVSDKGQLVRLEARLDGRAWSRFDLTPAPGVTF